MEEPQKINRFKKSWLLTKSAWHALLLDKEMLALPIYSFVLSLLLFVPAAIFAIFNPNELFYSNIDQLESTIEPVGYAAVLLAGLLASIFGTLMSAAVIHAAIERFKGNDPSVRSSLSAVKKRAGSLIAFAIFSSVIGYVMSLIIEKIPFIGGKIVIFLADAAWQIASSFAIPAIVTSTEPIGPIKATKTSVKTIKKVWGESLIAGSTVGIVAVLSMIIYMGIVTMIFGLTIALELPGLVIFATTIISLIGLAAFAVIFSVLGAYVKAAIYYYATTGESPVTFNKQILRQVFSNKKARKIFGA